MRYRINHHIIIRSENAAKPEVQSSTYLRTLITGLPSVAASFDYGCGKLRYVDVMLKTTDSLIMVDSEIQLSRTQVINGQLTTIRAVSAASNRASAVNVAEFERLPQRFDRGFCINLLPIIPIEAIRRRVLKLIRSKLCSGGTCLFVVQYRNSDFTRMLAMPNTQRWGDGILVNSLRGFSFYGLISPNCLASMVSDAGFALAERALNEGSIYLWGRVR